LSRKGKALERGLPFLGARELKGGGVKKKNFEKLDEEKEKTDRSFGFFKSLNFGNHSFR